MNLFLFVQGFGPFSDLRLLHRRYRRRRDPSHRKTFLSYAIATVWLSETAGIVLSRSLRRHQHHRERQGLAQVTKIMMRRNFQFLYFCFI